MVERSAINSQPEERAKLSSQRATCHWSWWIGNSRGWPKGWLPPLAFVSTFVPVLHTEISVYHPMWLPIVVAVGKLRDRCVDHRSFSLLRYPFLHHTPSLPSFPPSSSLVFVIDHPPLVHLSFLSLSLSFELWIPLLVVGKPSPDWKRIGYLLIRLACRHIPCLHRKS